MTFTGNMRYAPTQTLCKLLWAILRSFVSQGIEGAGLGGPLDAPFGFNLREAFQSQTNTEKILYNESCYALMCYRN